jgi:hypothetical protein
LTKLAEKPVMSLEQSLSLLGAITDLHDLCLILVRHLQRAARQRGHGSAMEVVDR